MQKKLYKPNEVTEVKSSFLVRGVSNTHAVNTLTNTDQIQKPTNDNGLTALIDWFAVTFDKKEFELYNVFEILLKYFELPSATPLKNIEEIEELDERETPWMLNAAFEKGYYSSLSYGKIAVFYDDYGRGEKGYKLRFNGQACREAELLFRDGYNWFDLFAELLRLKVNITRIDLAIDDKVGFFTVPDLIDLVFQKCCVSKLRNWDRHDGGKLVNGSLEGSTLTLGSPRSRIKINFYEKNHERANKLNDESLRSQIWNRTEMQIKETRALQTVEKLVAGRNDPENVGKIALGILSHYVKFCKPGQDDSNRSRWEPTDEWKSFIEGVSKVQLYEAAPDTDMETKKAWLWRQVPKTLAQLIISEYGENAFDPQYLKQNPDYLVNMVSYGVTKLENKDYKLIEQHKNMKKNTTRQSGVK